MSGVMAAQTESQQGLSLVLYFDLPGGSLLVTGDGNRCLQVIEQQDENNCSQDEGPQSKSIKGSLALPTECPIRHATHSQVSFGRTLSDRTNATQLGVSLAPRESARLEK